MTEDKIPNHELPAEYDQETHVERTEVGVTITTQIKRGTGTRDEDKHKVKAKGRTVEHARDQHRQGMDYLEKEVVDRTRSLDPSRDEE